MKALNNFVMRMTRPRFVITLIVLAASSIFIGALFPQIGDKNPSYFETWRLRSPQTMYLVELLQLNRVYSSFWFLSLVFLILSALSCSVYSQVAKILKKTVALPPPRDAWEAIPAEPGLDPDKVSLIMKQRGYSPGQAGQVMVFFKNSINRWGVPLFHFGLVLIIAAGLAGLAFHKRGFVQIMENELFSGSHEDFLSISTGPLQNRFDTHFNTRLIGLSRSYWDTDQVKDISSALVLVDESGNQSKGTIGVNHPLTFRGVRIYQTLNYGYALSFAMKDADGREAAGHFMLDAPEERSKPFTGFSDFPQTPYIFSMKFYPDIAMNSFFAGRPILFLRVSNGARAVLFDGLIAPGNVINVEGTLFKFRSVTPWSGLTYVRSVDISLAYAGFIVSCIGAMVTFLLPYKEFFFAHEGDVLAFFARTNRYRPLFREEVETITRCLTKPC